MMLGSRPTAREERERAPAPAAAPPPIPSPVPPPAPAARARAAEPGLALFDLNDLRRRPRHHNEAVIRRLCVNAYLGNQTALCRVLGRYKMYVDTTDISISSHLLLEGYWEMWVTMAMLGLVRPGMVAVDVGANLGYFTLLFADLVGAAGRVYAFEPNPAIRRRLTQSVLVNGFSPRTTVHGEPLSGEVGDRVRLIVPENEPGGAHIVPENDAGDEGTPVLTTTIDEVVGDGPVDFIKIDAEGAEQNIWRGMRHLLARGQKLTVVMEFNATRYDDAAGFLAEIAAEGFAMALLEASAEVVPTTPAAVLAREPSEVLMLVLSR